VGVQLDSPQSQKKRKWEKKNRKKKKKLRIAPFWVFFNHLKKILRGQKCGPPFFLESKQKLVMKNWATHGGKCNTSFNGAFFNRALWAKSLIIPVKGDYYLLMDP